MLKKMLSAVIISLLCTPPSFAFKRVGYFAEWGVYGRQYEVADIPANNLTDVLYAFIIIDPQTYTCKIYDEWAALDKPYPAKNGLPAQTWAPDSPRGSLARLQALKKLYPHLNVALSVGGWTKSSEFSQATQPEHIDRFAESCVALVNQYGFDGLDYDWEFPVEGGLASNDHSPQDKQHFTDLLRKTRALLGDDKTLTVAVSPNYKYIKNIDVPAINQYVDSIYLMTYDYQGSWNQYTAHHAPLYPNASNNFDTPEDRQHLNISKTVEGYIKAGAPADKLVVGVPFYGRSWRAESSVNNALYQAATSDTSVDTEGNWEPGFYDYWRIDNMITEGKLTEYYDEESGASYAYDPSSKLFISYDNKKAIEHKMQYILTHHLGGIMFWELSGDTARGNQTLPGNSLLGTIAEILKKSQK